MARDMVQTLLTAILMVVGVIALEPATLGGDRGRALEPAERPVLEPCDLLQSCLVPVEPEDDENPEDIRDFPGDRSHPLESPKPQ